MSDAKGNGNGGRRINLGMREIIDGIVIAAAGSALAGVVYLIMSVSHMGELDRRMALIEHQNDIDNGLLAKIEHSYVSPEQHEALRAIVSANAQEVYVSKTLQQQNVARLDRMEQDLRNDIKVTTELAERVRALEQQFGGK